MMKQLFSRLFSRPSFVRTLRIFLASCGCTLLFASANGCFHTPKPRLLSEDIEVLTVFANDIKVLKRADLATNSPEKYAAAKHLAEGVDFTLTRNVATLDNLFRAEDAATTRTQEYGDEINFYFQTGDHFVRMRFWRSGNMITESEIRIQ